MTVEPHSGSVAARPPADVADYLRMPFRRPIVGLGTTAAVAIVLAREGMSGRAALDAFFLASLVVLAAIDFEQRILPNRLVLPATAIVLVFQAAISPAEAVRAAVSAAAAFFLLLVPAALRPGALGMGDVKLGLLLGAGLGGSVLTGLLVGFLAVVPVALYLLVRRGAAARTVPLPLGPFLAFGAAVVVLAGVPTL
jgi:leader peptidase (prepilin peptidase)/N-methyltransferase